MDFDFIYAEIITITGWTWEYIDNFEWKKFIVLAEHWKDHPPIHRMIAGYFNLQPKKKGKIEDLIQAFGSGGEIRSG